MSEHNQEKQPISRLERDYPDWPDKQKQQFFGIAKIMVQTGAAKGPELDFILGTLPELGKNWVEANPDAQSLIEEFQGSNRWLSWALARTYHLTYDNVYHALKQSPLRPHMGDYTVELHPRPFLEDDHSVRVKAIEPEGIDLTDLRKGYYIERDFNEFSLNADGYLNNLQVRITNEQDQRQIQALQEVYDFYCQVRDLSFPALQTQLMGRLGQLPLDKNGNEITFPSNHQKAAIVKAAQEGSLAVFDGTGSGKTGIGIGFAEKIGAKRVLVVCPANVKDTWARRIAHEYYKSDPGVIKVGRQNKQSVANGEKYTLVNYELLINRDNTGENTTDVLSPLAKRLLASNSDLLILDESHYISNENKRSDAVLELARRIKHKLILTATPLRNSVDDLSRIAYLLSPNEFTTPDALRELGESGVSLLCELLATKTIRRKTEDLLELPPFCPENDGKIEYLQLELNPTHRAVYDTIFDDSSLDLFSKLKLLRLAAIDHNLIRGNKYKIPFEEPQATNELQRAYKSWKKQQEKGIDISFDSDYLVTHGYKHLFVGAHLQYKKGIEQLIQKHGSDEIKEAWQGVVVSTKFQKVRDLIKKRLARGEKVVVFSGHFIKGVLRETIDDVTGEKIEQDLYSYLRREFPDVEIGRIDGQVSPSAPTGKVSKRDQERQRWQDDPNYRILLTSVPSSSLGTDLTVDDGITTGIDIIGLDLPYTHAAFWQMISRVFRFGQKNPVNAQILEAIKTVDLGVHALVNRKGEDEEELLDGLTPPELTRQLFDHSKTKSFLVEYITSPKREMEKTFYAMRGQGVTANGVYLEQVLQDGKTIGEMIAELYSRYWEYTYSGHTARLLQQVVDGLRTVPNSKINLIVDAGSGPLIFERTMRLESQSCEGLKVINVDINKHMLESGLTELQKLGQIVDRSNIINRPMSDTGLMANSCDAAVCSLAFHYSSSTEDRGKILVEANRILRSGGYYFITLPESYLTPEQFEAFGKALRKFGFEVDKTISGQAKAIDHQDIPFSSWLIAARKVGTPSQDDLTMEEFRFNFEGSKIAKYKEENEGKGHEKQKESQDRLVKHERFLILDPDNLQAKGSPAEILSRLGLGLSEEELQKHGWKMQVKQTKDGTEVTIKK